MASALDNYLRHHRRRTGLTQDELAFLLGCREGSKVSRYEHFSRQPNLITALACEAVFKTPTRELFAGLYQKAEKRVRRRAKLLQHRRQNQTDRRGAGLGTLRSILESESNPAKA